MVSGKKILITGGTGFLARNAKAYFEKNNDVSSVSHNDEYELLFERCKDADLVFHFAAVQRSDNEQYFWDGNVEYTRRLIGCLEKNGNTAPILFTSSIGIFKDGPFSQTKVAAEKLIRAHCERYNSSVFVFLLNNVFGRFGKPNFNNVIATFCYNVAHGIPIVVNDPSVIIPFSYVDDVLLDFEHALQSKPISGYYRTSVQYSKTLGEIVFILGRLKNGDPPLNDFEEKIKKTYYSYLNTSVELLKQ